jgi:hypothetical protein
MQTHRHKHTQAARWFLSLLRSNGGGIHRQIHRLSFDTTRRAYKTTRPTFLLLLRCILCRSNVFAEQLSSNVHIQTHWLMGGIYEVRHSDGFTCHIMHTSLSLFLLLLPLWNIGHPWNALLHFSSLILRQSVGFLWRGISQSQGRYLYKATRWQNTCRHPYFEWDSNPWSQCSSIRRQFMP